MTRKKKFFYSYQNKTTMMHLFKTVQGKVAELQMDILELEVRRAGEAEKVCLFKCFAL